MTFSEPKTFTPTRKIDRSFKVPYLSPSKWKLTFLSTRKPTFCADSEPSRLLKLFSKRPLVFPAPPMIFPLRIRRSSLNPSREVGLSPIKRVKRIRWTKRNEWYISEWSEWSKQLPARPANRKMNADAQLPRELPITEKFYWGILSPY